MSEVAPHSKEGDMSDIVERLRSPDVFVCTSAMISPVAYEAAAEIERLRVMVLATTRALETVCDAVNIDLGETFIRAKNSKTGEVLAKRSLADILAEARAALNPAKEQPRQARAALNPAKEQPRQARAAYLPAWDTYSDAMSSGLSHPEAWAAVERAIYEDAAKVAEPLPAPTASLDYPSDYKDGRRAAAAAIRARATQPDKDK